MEKEELYKAIKNFKFYAVPSNGDSSAPATVSDIHKLINETAKLAEKIVNAIND